MILNVHQSTQNKGYNVFKSTEGKSESSLERCKSTPQKKVVLETVIVQELARVKQIALMMMRLNTINEGQKVFVRVFF